MLTEKKATVAEERSTKQPLSTAEVRTLLAGVETVVIARGRRVERIPARKVKPADLKGPTGGFRAPMLQCGRTLLVGFHPDSLAALVG